MNMPINFNRNLQVDDWLRLRVPEARPEQLAVLRCRLAAAFAFKV